MIACVIVSSARWKKYVHIDVGNWKKLESKINRDLSIDQNNRDYDFCHNRAALVHSCGPYFIGNVPMSLASSTSFCFASLLLGLTRGPHVSRPKKPETLDVHA